MLFLYKVITNILYPILILYMYFRKLIKKEHSKRFKEKIYPSHFNVNKTENSKLCWFHAVSIGELNSILPIIEEINTKYTNYEFLITTTTLSSANLINKKSKNLKNIQHRFFLPAANITDLKKRRLGIFYQFLATDSSSRSLTILD